MVLAPIGLVRTVPGADARTKKIVLTAKARRIVGQLAAEWRATEAAATASYPALLRAFLAEKLDTQ